MPNRTGQTFEQLIFRISKCDFGEIGSTLLPYTYVIMGLVHGGATLRPRSGTGKGEEYDPSAGHMEFLDSLEED
jgi:hypothetical protein